MRDKIVAGNWKMNLSFEQALHYREVQTLATLVISLQAGQLPNLQLHLLRKNTKQVLF